jgi:hypothetical protein
VLVLYRQKRTVHLCLITQMTEELDIRNIEILIGEDDLVQASKMLWEWVYFCGGFKEKDEVILLKRRISEIEREARQRTLSFDEKSRHRTQLANDLLVTLRTLRP